jgi:hypothetical protein
MVALAPSPSSSSAKSALQKEITTVMLDHSGYWSARSDYPDQQVPQRNWITELGLAKRDDGSLVFGCRLQCVTLNEDRPLTRSVPSLVRDIFDCGIVLLDGYRAYPTPVVIQTKSDVSWLIKLIRDENRRRDVIVFSLPDGSNDPSETLANPQAVARRCAGAGHLAILTSDASYMLTDFVGKELSVFREAVRTYRPGFVLDDVDPADHPLAMPDRIRIWNGVGPQAFEEFIVEQFLASTVRGRDLQAELPSFTMVRRAVLDSRRQALVAEGATDAALLAVAEEEIAQLKGQLDDGKQETDALLQQADAERQQLESDLERRRLDIVGLRARLRALELARQEHGSSLDAPMPESFENLADWEKDNLAGSVVILPRAHRAAKKSNFEDVELAYRALLVLRDHYVPMRRRGSPRDDYMSALAKLGLDDQPCFGGGGAGGYGDEYAVTYGGRKREFERHLKGSNTRDPRFGFRLYFFWDEEFEQVVVGSMPEHLTTAVT